MLHVLVVAALLGNHLEDPGEGHPKFRRGDADGSGAVNISDAIFILNWAFLGGEEPSCRAAADWDSDNNINHLTEAVRILTWLFQGSFPSSKPGPFECGHGRLDPFVEDCKSYTAC